MAGRGRRHLATFLFPVVAEPIAGQTHRYPTRQNPRTGNMSSRDWHDVGLRPRNDQRACMSGMTLAFRQFLFTADGQPLHVFYGLYEDPSGPGVIANRRKSAASRVSTQHWLAAGILASVFWKSPSRVRRNRRMRELRSRVRCHR